MAWELLPIRRWGDRCWRLVVDFVLLAVGGTCEEVEKAHVELGGFQRP